MQRTGKSPERPPALDNHHVVFTESDIERVGELFIVDLACSFLVTDHLLTKFTSTVVLLQQQQKAITQSRTFFDSS
jgi:hypothetical protein